MIATISMDDEKGDRPYYPHYVETGSLPVRIGMKYEEEKNRFRYFFFLFLKVPEAEPMPVYKIESEPAQPIKYTRVRRQFAPQRTT